MIGRRLSHFRVLERIGEGGMGVVYKAEDERLHRAVALKVLPPDSIADEERRLRFLREARAAASLTHPNIATIYEVDEADGIVFIAMELIEGKTLRSSLAGRPLPMKDALRIGIEISEGLAKAHQARIVHRDLKPDNVMVTGDGHVKILDFGLAKLLERGDEVPVSEASRLETISGEMTRQGRILGTASYMSPEQARGLSVDNRSDLFSFGIVLYEMVTGTAPFRGPTPMDTLSAILRNPVVPASQLNNEVPQELERILGKCLEKDPAERYQDARDLVVDLKRLKRDTESQPLARPTTGPLATTPSAASPRAPGARRSSVPSIVAGSMVLVASLAWLGWRFWPNPLPQTPEFKQRQVFSDPTHAVTDLSMSLDGKYLAIVGATGLSVRQINTGEIRHLAVAEGQLLRAATWAVDGTKLFVTTKDSTGRLSIWSVPLLTGTPRLIRGDDCGRPIPSPDGNLLAYEHWVGNYWELWVMDSEGGSARKILAPAAGEGLRGFTWAPKSRRIGYVRLQGVGEKGPMGIIESRDIDSGSTTSILTDPRVALAYYAGSGLNWLSDGRLVFSLTEPPPNITDANLWSLRVDPTTGIPEGTATRITSWAGGLPRPAGATADGKALLVSKEQAQSDVWIGELQGGGTRLSAPRRLTLDNHQDRASFWMPDSRRIVFVSDRNGSFDLLAQDLDGGDVVPVIVGPGEVSGGILTPRQDSILFAEAPPGGSPMGDLTLKRAGISGGAVETLFQLPALGECGMDCPSDPRGSCLFGELVAKKAVFYELDPIKGKGRKVIEVDWPAPILNWILSRDGSQIAYLQEIGSAVLIKILTLASGATQEIPVKGRWNVQSIAWAGDGESFFAANYDPPGKSAIFRVDSKGAMQVLLEPSQAGEWLGNPMPSPDGRYLAFHSIGFFSDYWLLEGF